MVLLPENSCFDKVFDFSNASLPEMSQDEFDRFYAHWIDAAGRESNIDECGQLVFFARTA